MREKKKKLLPTPGIEPGPPGWKPGILTTRPNGTAWRQPSKNAYLDTYPSVHCGLSSGAVVLQVDGGCSAAYNDQWGRAKIKHCSKITQKQLAGTWLAQMYISCHWSPHKRLGLQNLNITHTETTVSHHAGIFHMHHLSGIIHRLKPRNQSPKFRPKTYTQLHACTSK